MSKSGNGNPENEYGTVQDALPPMRPKKSAYAQKAQEEFLAQAASSGVKISSVNEEDIYSTPQEAAPPRPKKPDAMRGALTPESPGLDLGIGPKEDIYGTVERGASLKDLQARHNQETTAVKSTIGSAIYEEPVKVGSVPENEENFYEVPVVASRRSAHQDRLPDSPISLFDAAMAEIEGAIQAGRKLRTGKAFDSKEAKQANALGQTALSHFKEALAEIFKNSDQDLKNAKDTEGNTLFDKVADAAIRHCSLDTAPQPAITGFSNALTRLTEDMFDQEMPISPARDEKLNKAGIGPAAPERGGRDKDSGLGSEFSMSSNASVKSASKSADVELGSAAKAVLAAREAAKASPNKGGRF